MRMKTTSQNETKQALILLLSLQAKMLRHYKRKQSSWSSQLEQAIDHLLKATERN